MAQCDATGTSYSTRLKTRTWVCSSPSANKHVSFNPPLSATVTTEYARDWFLHSRPGRSHMQTQTVVECLIHAKRGFQGFRVSGTRVTHMNSPPESHTHPDPQGAEQPVQAAHSPVQLTGVPQVWLLQSSATVPLSAASHLQKWAAQTVNLSKRAGTSPVNAVVRETIMERQVHFQSSD